MEIRSRINRNHCIDSQPKYRNTLACMYTIEEQEEEEVEEIHKQICPTIPALYYAIRIGVQEAGGQCTDKRTLSACVGRQHHSIGARVVSFAHSVSAARADVCEICLCVNRTDKRALFRSYEPTKQLIQVNISQSCALLFKQKLRKLSIHCTLCTL